MRILLILMLTSYFSYATNKFYCLSVTFRNTNLTEYEKKECCDFLYDNDIDLTLRSNNGWHRYAIRNNWDDDKKDFFNKCKNSYFDSLKSVRVGGSI